MAPILIEPQMPEEVKYEPVTEAEKRSLDSMLLSYLLSMARMVVFVKMMTVRMRR